MIDEHLLRFNKEQKYCLFDYETCNLNLVNKENLPWELAWWVVTIDRVIKKRALLINWEKNGLKLKISDDAARMTGFYMKKPALIAHGVSGDEALEEFEQDLYDPSIIPIAHNGLGFDVYIHNTHRKVLGKKTDYSYVDRFIDTNLIALAWKKNISPPKGREELHSFQRKLRKENRKGFKTSVKALCEDFGIEYDETKAHDADYDCNLLYQILKQLLFKVEI